MEELIKEAESLYLELSRITESLVFARLHDDYDLLHGCRNELENFAQSVIQTLKCLVDCKDNIVDLSKVWHKYNPKQEICDDIIACYNDNVIVNVHSQNEIDILLRHNRHLEGKIYFSFVKDLLPKRDSK